MRKFRRIIPFLLALIMVLAVPLAACDSCGGKKEEEKTLQSISLNTDDVKTEYAFDQEFTAAGLVVKATYINDKTNQPVEVTLAEGDYVVNSKGYKKNAEGTYTIVVSHTHRDVTKEANYNVTVTLYQDGLEVTLVEGVLPGDADKIDTYSLSATKTTVEIDTSKIVVKKVNDDGTVGAAITDYNTSLYRGQEKIELTNGKASVGRGVYAIVVEKDSEIFDNYPLVSFALIYVNDDMVDFVLKSGVGTFEQAMGADVISGTWVFEATYVSGAKADITADKCEFELDTMEVGENNVVVVSYTDYNATGAAVTKAANVTYTITRKYGKTVYTYDMNAIVGISDITVDNTPLTQSMFKGANSFLKVGNDSVIYRTGSKVIELLKTKSIKVTFGGTGSITVGFSSTGGSNYARVCLQDANGNCIPATYSDSTVKVDESASNVYLVYGTTSRELTFNITQPGTYSIVCASNSSYNRNCRIHSVVLEDNVPEPAAAMLSADKQTYISYNKDEIV